jgi:hypothetical protein
MLELDNQQDQEQDREAITETLHLWVTRDDIRQPSPLPIVLSVFALTVLFTLCLLSPYRQPVVRTTIRVPAVYPPVQFYSASAPVSATGIKTVQATVAHGILTLTNGSVVGQDLPAGLVFASSSGIEVITETGVYVPAGSANGYGYATVEAKAVTGGVQGNIPALSINSVYGTALYIRNLQAFAGGKDAYSVKIETDQDRQNAIYAARSVLVPKAIHLDTYLVRPCSEQVQLLFRNNNLRQLTLVWSCQYVTFSVPAMMHVTGVRLVGKNVYVDVEYTPRPSIIWFK